MKLEHNISKLKNGINVTIRVPEISEAQKLLELKRSYLKDTKTIPMTIEEYPDDVNHESELIQKYRTSTNSLLLVAEFQNELIGNIDLTGSNRSKMFHTGVIGMGIKEQYRNLGLGRIFIESIIKWARDSSPLELIWLEVYANNNSGLNLYKSTGFKISGVVKNFFKEGNTHIDKIQMYQNL